jgi:hypothetical protein
VHHTGIGSTSGIEFDDSGLIVFKVKPPARPGLGGEAAKRRGTARWAWIVDGFATREVRKPLIERQVLDRAEHGAGRDFFMAGYQAAGAA